jgi:hypothetical protein
VEQEQYGNQPNFVLFSFLYGGDKLWKTGARNLRFCTEIYHVPPKYSVKSKFSILTNANMATVRKLEVISHKCNLPGNCASQNYVQK